MEDQEEICDSATQLVWVTALPMTLKAAIELNLLEIIGRAGHGAQLLPEEIAAQLPTENPDAAVRVDRMLRLLASHSFLTCSAVNGDDGTVRRRYGLAPVSSLFIPNEDGVSMAAPFLLSQDKVLMESWYCLKDAVLDGGDPFEKAYGMTTFEYHGKDPRFRKVFHAGMSNHSTFFMKKMLEVYKGFDGSEVLVDVGGGTGVSLNMILSAYPSIKGINFDLPHVIAEAPPFEGVEHVSGDMFERVPAGDAIFMKWILHDWSDEKCLSVLKNCWKALPEKGKVIVMEGILPEVPETTKGAQALAYMDMIMLTVNPGGKERTEKEFSSLAKSAGFFGFAKVCSTVGFWIMEFTK